MILGEIIGKRARVVHSSCPEQMGLEGTIVDETKNTVSIRTEKGVKKFPKENIILELELGRKKILLNCKRIMFRPEERTKKLWRKLRWRKKRVPTKNARTTGT